MKIRADFLNTPPASQHAGSTSATASANTMSNFASLLQQQSRAPALAPMPPPVVAAVQKPAPGASQASGPDKSPENKASEPADESVDSADEAAQDDTANKPRLTNKPRARQGDAQAPARAVRDENTPARTDKKNAAADEDSSATPAESKAHGDAATPTWLAGWMPPPMPTAAQAAPGGQRGAGLPETTDGTDALPGDAEAAGNPIGAARGRGLPPGAKKADAHDALDAVEADRGAAANPKEPATSLPGFAAVLAEQRHADTAASRDGAAAPIDAARAAAASSTPANGSTSHDASSTSNAHVRAAVGSPEFPQELGVQLSVLARDGVQEAELHLNPAEMGPLSVQIVMDGTQARIDFGADVAATRQAIEAGLPELASALRDAGFTLAGGGVSQHAGGRQGSEGDGARRDGAAPRGKLSSIDGGDSASRVVRTRVRAGGVDVYA